ncbi:response regulator [Magnetococcales bacterium HHB-1]
MDNVYICEEPTILAIDDDIDQLNLIDNFLSRRGFSVHTTNNGFEIIDKIQVHQPDLILIDALMPGRDGFNVCKELKEHAKSRNVPIMMMTSLEDPEIINWAFDCGIDDYIRKPIIMELLKSRILRLLESKKNEMNLYYSNAKLETKLLKQEQEMMRLRNLVKQEMLDHKRTKRQLISLSKGGFNHTMMASAHA